MADAIRLPKVPGLTPSAPPTAAPRRQTLSWKNGYALTELSAGPAAIEVQGRFADCLAPATAESARAANASPAAPSLPDYVINDKKVLRFYASFEEAVPEGFSATEKSRVRKLEVLYYLEDSTVAVNEPRIANSGMLGGPFLARNKLARAPAGSGFVTPTDIVVGGELQLGSRSVRVHGVDAFTRSYFQERGIPQPPDYEPYKVDNSAAPERSAQRTQRAQTESVTRGMQWLAHDGQVLRFDGRVLEHDLEPREVVVHYYLADSTLEVKEKENGSLLLRRRRLPVVARGAGVDAVGEDPSEEYVRAGELRVGAAIDVYSRTLLLTDADPFTRAWYSESAGIEQAEAMPSLPRAPPAQAAPPPPHNGWGDEADSLRNVGVLIPKKAVNIEAHSRFQTLSGMQLRFTATMVSVPGAKPLHETDNGRLFIITIYPEDDSMAIFEQPQRDIPGGRYLERIVVPNADGGKPITHQDVAVGSTIQVFGRRFLITAADKYTEAQKAK